MNFEELIKRTIEINSRFKKEFDDHDRVLSLVSEVGELADAVLEYDGGKEKGTRNPKGKAEIADALADLLYNLTLVAWHYEIDLPQEYAKVLDEVEKRLADGEFVTAQKSTDRG
ncbi:MAG: MazG nucleotide pyrophosphohydrolase domain-containing protein [bacterium]|nr:MazG nucleotide pyrophosphohydrolase domain-containing protein [bacterium]